MDAHRRAGSQKGSALVISLIVVVMGITLLFAFIAMPEATFRQVQQAQKREQALLCADAAVRDAVVWRTQNQAVVLPKSSPAGAATPSWVEWGDPTNKFRDAYQWTMSDAGNGFTKILTRGRVAVDMGSRSAGTISYVEVDLEVFITKSSASSTLPDVAGAMFAQAPGNTHLFWINTNANNQFTANTVWVPMTKPQVFMNNNGGDPIAVNGTDFSGQSAQAAGVMFQDSNFQLTGNITGNPPVNTSVSSTSWQKVSDLVSTVQTLTSNGSTIFIYTYPNGTPVAGIANTAIMYVKIPAGSYVTDEIMQINGNQPIYGVLVIDVDDNVHFLSGHAVYLKNGTSGFRGAIIFYQRGNIYVTNKADGPPDNITGPNDGIFFIKKDGNNDNYVQYDSVAIKGALGNVPSASGAYKVVSYRVMQKTGKTGGSEN